MKKMLVVVISLGAVAALMTASLAQRGRSPQDPECRKKCQAKYEACKKDPANIGPQDRKGTKCHDPYQGCLRACKA